MFGFLDHQFGCDTFEHFTLSCDTPPLPHRFFNHASSSYPSLHHLHVRLCIMIDVSLHVLPLSSNRYSCAYSLVVVSTSFLELPFQVFSIVRSYSSMFTRRMTVFVIPNQRHRMCSALMLHPHSLKVTGTYPQWYWVLKPCSTLRRPLARTFDPAEASNSGLGVLVCRDRLVDGSNYHWEHEREVEVPADVMEPEPLLPSTHV
jgi:hypothetical protein